MNSENYISNCYVYRMENGHKKLIKTIRPEEQWQLEERKYIPRNAEVNDAEIILMVKANPCTCKLTHGTFDALGKGKRTVIKCMDHFLKVIVDKSGQLHSSGKLNKNVTDFLRNYCKPQKNVFFYIYGEIVDNAIVFDLNKTVAYDKGEKFPWRIKYTDDGYDNFY